MIDRAYQLDICVGVLRCGQVQEKVSKGSGRMYQIMSVTVGGEMRSVYSEYQVSRCRKLEGAVVSCVSEVSKNGPYRNLTVLSISSLPDMFANSPSDGPDFDASFDLQG